MSELFLVRDDDGRVQVYAWQQGNWRMIRMPPHLLKNSRIAMCFGTKGWHIKEGNVKIISKTPLSEQDPHHPPLGQWCGVESEKPGSAWYGGWILTDSKPCCPPMGPISPIQTSFLSVRCTFEGSHNVRIDIKLHNKPIVDDELEKVFAILKRAIEDMASRPDTTMLMTVSLQDAAVPAMRHVKRLISFSQEVGDMLFLIGRGNAIILKPTGFFGSAFVSIIRIVQTAAPPPWPETIVPSSDEAEVFLSKLLPLPESSPLNDHKSVAKPRAATAASPAAPASSDVQSSLRQVESTKQAEEEPPSNMFAKIEVGTTMQSEVDKADSDDRRHSWVAGCSMETHGLSSGDLEVGVRKPRVCCWFCCCRRRAVPNAAPSQTTAPTPLLAPAPVPLSAPLVHVPCPSTAGVRLKLEPEPEVLGLKVEEDVEEARVDDVTHIEPEIFRQRGCSCVLCPEKQ